MPGLQVLARPPWLYVDSDSDSEEKTETEISVLPVGAEADAAELCGEADSKQTTQRGRVKLVRCRGVLANGTPCTRTTWIPVYPEDEAKLGAHRPLYCQRHLGQHREQSGGKTRQVRRRLSSRREDDVGGGVSAGLAVKTLAVGVLSVLSLAAVVGGLYAGRALLCAVGGLGLFSAACGICVVACQALVNALPTASAAEIAAAIRAKQSEHVEDATRQQILVKVDAGKEDPAAKGA